jgi:hypothetical protein
MSFSLRTWLAEHSKGRKKSRLRSLKPQPELECIGNPRPATALGLHSCRALSSGWQRSVYRPILGAPWGQVLRVKSFYRNHKSEQLKQLWAESVTHVLNLKCYRCPDRTTRVFLSFILYTLSFILFLAPPLLPLAWPSFHSRVRPAKSGLSTGRGTLATSNCSGQHDLADQAGPKQTGALCPLIFDRIDGPQHE